jgi:hypothetical protein
VSNVLSELQFKELYKPATDEPYNALVIDNHPKQRGTSDLKRF